MTVRRYFHSLSFKMLLAVLGMLILLAGAVAYNGYRVIHEAMVTNVQVTVKQTSQIFNLAVSPYASNNQLDVLRVYLQELIEGDGGDENSLGVIYIAINQDDGSSLVRAGKVPIPLPQPDNAGYYEASAYRGIVHVRQPILLSDNRVGYLQFGLSTELMVAAANQAIREGAMLAVMGVVVSSTFLLYMGLLFSRRVHEVIDASAAIASGDYLQAVPERGGDEIAQLAKHFNQMADAIRQRVAALEESRAKIGWLNEGLERRVHERTQALETLNVTLQETMVQREIMQESLVRSENLAGLGALVAGVAHELNTPLGNALTVATTLEDTTREFAREIETGLRRSALTGFVEQVKMSSELVTRNLARAADLITSFKHVAVDQTSSQRRDFDLGEVVNEVAATLRPTFKGKPYQLEIDVPDGIRMDSYPGPLGQIITNLINNALLHAFAGRASGTMRIQVRQVEEGRVALSFCDDGNGIPPEHLKRIFDPFFTTRLGHGGSGLGLNIVHNMVAGLLGGSIKAQSPSGQGACFFLDLPCVAPEQTHVE